MNMNRKGVNPYKIDIHLGYFFTLKSQIVCDSTKTPNTDS